ncbi:MAG: hypothetical protein OXU77_14675 [Gammaproteobacteria bacterium]|nr:hypothetical protein [Gammaproteobacteria bacterium]MDE0441422.1 hypothetical protein [Gammaproteobacteria bacterium]
MTAFANVGPANLRPNGTWLLTGIPRSGSSLACRLAGQLPDFVALSEPMARAEFAGLATPSEALSTIERFARRTRERVATRRRASTVQVDGRLADDMVVADAVDGLRRRQVAQAEVDIDKPLSEGFSLLVKHNALFAALLPQLTPIFRCIGLVRNPLSVLASWQTVDMPVNRGRIPAGEQFDPVLHKTLDCDPDALSRQLTIINWFFAHYGDDLAAERILRYEDLVASGGNALFGMLGHAQAKAVPLTSRNDHAIYRDADIDRLLAALVDRGGAWTRFYSRTDCEAVAEGLAPE